MKYSPVKLTKHHRVPTSVQTGLGEMNISFVPRREHELYHALWYNKSPQEVARDLTDRYLPKGYVMVVYSKRGNNRMPVFGRPLDAKPVRAMEFFTNLFGEMNPQQIAEKLNDKFIDPNYYFVVERKEVA